MGAPSAHHVALILGAQGVCAITTAVFALGVLRPSLGAALASRTLQLERKGT